MVGIIDIAKVASISDFGYHNRRQSSKILDDGNFSSCLNIVVEKVSSVEFFKFFEYGNYG